MEIGDAQCTSLRLLWHTQAPVQTALSTLLPTATFAEAYIHQLKMVFCCFWLFDKNTAKGTVTGSATRLDSVVSCHSLSVDNNKKNSNDINGQLIPEKKISFGVSEVQNTTAQGKTNMGFVNSIDTDVHESTFVIFQADKKEIYNDALLSEKENEGEDKFGSPMEETEVGTGQYESCI